MYTRAVIGGTFAWWPMKHGINGLCWFAAPAPPYKRHPSATRSLEWYELSCPKRFPAEYSTLAGPSWIRFLLLKLAGVYLRLALELLHDVQKVVVDLRLGVELELDLGAKVLVKYIARYHEGSAGFVAKEVGACYTYTVLSHVIQNGAPSKWMVLFA